MKSIIIIIIGFIANCQAVIAQAPDTSWTNTYGGDHHDYATSFTVTDDNGFLLTGVTYSYGPGDRDVYLVKTNLNGDTLWTKTYGDSLIDHPLSIKPTYDGGYILGGVSSSFSGDETDFDFYLVKINASGELQWQNCCADTASSGAYDLVETYDYGYLMVGYARNYPAMNFDMFAVRADQLGDTIWTRRYLVPGRESWDGLAYCVTKTSDNNYVIAGEIRSWSDYISDIYVIKIDDTGELLWRQLIDYDALEYAWCSAETPDDDIVLAGWCWGGWADTLGDEVYMAKLSRGGDLLWQKAYAYDWPVYSYNGAWAITVDSSDYGYLIAADTRPAIITQRDIYIIKTDSDGDTLWTTKIGDLNDESPKDIAFTSDGGFAVCGMKYVENSLGYLYKDFYLMKFEAATQIPNENPLIPQNIHLLKNYPNPFNESTIIEFNISEIDNVTLVIFDVLGRKIYSLTPDNIHEGTNKLHWSAQESASGIYFYLLQAGNDSQIKKMTLRK